MAIVTGAGCVGPGWGNGRATAVRFVEEGAKIFAVDRDLDSMGETVERAEAAGGEIVTHQCDVTDAASVEAMVKACLDRFGRIDILVNNVGGSARGGPVELSEDRMGRSGRFQSEERFSDLKVRAPGDGGSEERAPLSISLQRQGCGGPAQRRSVTPRPKLA